MTLASAAISLQCVAQLSVQALSVHTNPFLLRAIVHWSIALVGAVATTFQVVGSTSQPFSSNNTNNDNNIHNNGRSKGSSITIRDEWQHWPSIFAWLRSGQFRTSWICCCVRTANTDYSLWLAIKVVSRSGQPVSVSHTCIPPHSQLPSVCRERTHKLLEQVDNLRYSCSILRCSSAHWSS